jgi:glycosyltransferase involved in cell wall biosynthesis
LASKILINALAATNRSSRYVLRTWLARHDAASDDVTLIIHGTVAGAFAHRDPIVVNGLLSSWWSRWLWEREQIPRLVRERGIEEVIHFGGFPLPALGVEQTAFLHNPIPFLAVTWEVPESRLKPRLQRMAYNSTLRHADRYVVPSAHMRDLVLEHVKDIDESAFKIIPHELPEDLAGLTHDPPQDGPFVLVTAGCWAPHKDLQSTIRTLHDLRETRGGCASCRHRGVGE